VEVPTPLPVVETVALFSKRIPWFPLPVPKAVPVAVIVPVEVLKVEPTPLIWIPLFPELDAVPARVMAPVAVETADPERMAIPSLTPTPLAPVPVIAIDAVLDAVTTAAKSTRIPPFKVPVPPPMPVKFIGPPEARTWVPVPVI
jgi:hypothetical protein